MKDSEAQIRHILNEYCFRVDAGNLSGFAELFSKGSWEVIGDPAGAYTGSEAVLGALQNVTLYKGKPLTRHVISNLEISIDAEQENAAARFYITVYQAVPPDFPLQAIFIGDYNVTFSKSDGEWFLVSMKISPELIGDLSHHRADMA